jgi:hypothetical protein
MFDYFDSASDLIDNFLLPDLTIISGSYLYMNPVVVELQKFKVFSNYHINTLEKISKDLIMVVIDYYKDYDMKNYKGFNDDLLSDALRKYIIADELFKSIPEDGWKELRDGFIEKIGVILNDNGILSGSKSVKDLAENFLIYLEDEKTEDFTIILELINKLQSEDISINGNFKYLKQAMVQRVSVLDDIIYDKKKYTVLQVGYEDRLIERALVMCAKSECNIVYIADYKEEIFPILEDKTDFLIDKLRKANIRYSGVCFEEDDDLGVIQDMHHCDCLGNDHYDKRVFEDDSVKITLYRYDTSSG